ncbi:hypothetical protein, partial [Maribacter caenipelagi]|uniref:hypothetical protein n=1 Tax=Maribacter caenipelagi TaxID=1447781 RepID=UPI001AAE2785
MKIYFKNIKVKYYFTLLLFICFSSSLFAQNVQIVGPTTVNKGETHRYYLSSTGFNTFNWSASGGSIPSSGNQYSDVYITWNSTTGGGQVVVSYMDGTQQRYASKPVTIKTPVGQVSKPTGTTNICQGTTFTDYSASATAASSYTWSIANAGTSTINGNGRVTWASNFYGTATITVRANGNDGSFTTNSTTVKVTETLKTYTISTSDPQNNNVCPGGTLSVKLSDSQVGVIYQLYKNGSNSPAIQTGSGG